MSAPPDVDTGVLNGDVDWLFRGKSKKLVKKLSESRAPVNEADHQPSKPPHHAPTDPAPGQAQCKHDSQASTLAASHSGPGSVAEKTEHADPSKPASRTGPHRSPEPNISPSSTPTAKKTSIMRHKECKELPSKAGFPPDDTRGTAPHESPVTRSRSGLTLGSAFHKSPQALLLPSGSRRGSVTTVPPLEGVSRSNSGKGRSFLSLLSSKIRSGSFSSSPKDDISAAVTRPPLEGGSMAKLSRRLSVSASPRLSTERDHGFFKRRPLDSAKSPLDKCADKETALPEIPEVHLRRVSFALDQLSSDPQQQIPSKRPKKGNVLIPEDLKAAAPRLAQGISVAEGARVVEPKYTEKEMQMAIEAHTKALAEAEKHALEAHISAKKLAAQIANHKTPKTGPEEEVVALAETIEIDKPLHMHENHFEPDVSVDTLSLEAVYTRCCHLREILPIPATLKQLKNKTKPLQVLKMLNPKPTLIDVLSFSDFISITPINTVIFDNVTMTTEMLKHFLSALVHNKQLEKLSLRNVAIDEQGWIYLCEFLRRNLGVKKLDVSQQRVKHEAKGTCVRSAMNWDLFVKALISRNGIEELVMGGCKLSDAMFENLVKSALSINTCRLGVAATEISVRKCEILADWISMPGSKCVGIDIAYNDLSGGQLRPFIDAFSTKSVNLIFFSLNSTSLTNVDEFNDLLKALTKVTTLRFLDISALPQLFPDVISKLSKHLPHFKSLRRIHFDLNELSSQSIAAIADILPSIPLLVHVSLLGNRNLDRGSIGAIYTAVKSSGIFTLDLDYDLVTDEFSQRLALYLMRNLDKGIRPDIPNTDDVQDDVLFDGSLLMETAEKMLMESEKSEIGVTDLKLQRIITNALIKRTNSVRKDMHNIIDKLFEKRDQEAILFEEKETLLRLCLLDASLEKVVHMSEQRAKMFAGPLSPSISNDDKIEGNGDNRKQLHEGFSSLIDAGSILMAKTVTVHPPSAILEHDLFLEPHQVVIESNADGKNIPIDKTTGRPVLMKSVLLTSLHAKEQEEEEGEFLRWGYFMEHREGQDSTSEAAAPEREVPLLSVVPSGSELREAIIDAKGIDSVTDLISKINNNRVSLDNILGSHTPDATHHEEEPVFVDAVADSTDSGSIELTNTEIHPVVDEAYDKLLNEALRVRSHRSESINDTRHECK